MSLGPEEGTRAGYRDDFWRWRDHETKAYDDVNSSGQMERTKRFFFWSLLDLRIDRWREGDMKGKPTWKPVGLRAKHWRDPGQVRGPANLIPQPKPPKDKVLFKKGETK